MILAYFIRFTLFHGMPGHIGLSYYLIAVLCVSPLFWLLYGLMGLYDSFRAKLLQEFNLLRGQHIIFGILLAFSLRSSSFTCRVGRCLCSLRAGNDRGGGQTMVSATAAAFVP
ncbi:MAG: hypothetical protein ACLRIO_04045 [Butyricicoccus sp.]